MTTDDMSASIKPAVDRLCAVLGLDPRTTTSIRLEIEAGMVMIHSTHAKPILVAADRRELIEDLASSLEHIDRTPGKRTT